MSLPTHPAFVSTTPETAGLRVVRALGVAEGIAVTLFTGFLPDGQQDVLRDLMAAAFMDMPQAARLGANAIVGLGYELPSSDRERICAANGSCRRREVSLVW